VRDRSPDLLLDDLDSLAAEAAQIPADLRRRAPAEHHPEERGREDVLSLAIDQDDPMLSVEPASQPVGGNESADAAAENHDACHWMSLLYAPHWHGYASQNA
jgi:hypothetical protein